MKLYELTENYKNLMAYIDEAETLDAEEEQAIIDTLDSLQDALEVKGDNICRFIKNLSADIEARKKEIDRLQKINKVDANKIDSLKKYLEMQMNIADIKKLDTELFKIGIRKSTSLEVMDIESLPIEYVKITKEARKTDIKNAIKDGLNIEGVKMVDKYSLQIR